MIGFEPVTDSDTMSFWDAVFDWQMEHRRNEDIEYLPERIDEIKAASIEQCKMDMVEYSVMMQHQISNCSMFWNPSYAPIRDEHLHGPDSRVKTTRKCTAKDLRFVGPFFGVNTMAEAEGLT